MKQNKRLSVVIPTYNRVKRVVLLCQQIMSQLVEGDELIVSDDASTDGTSEALSEITGVTVETQAKSLGMVANWNFCISSGTNDWVCLIHDDDELALGGLDAIRRVIDIATAPSIIAHSDWEPADREGLEDLTDLTYTARPAGSIASLKAEFCPSGVTMHRRVVEVVGQFEPAYKYSADMEYFSRVCKSFPSYIICTPSVVRYQRHGDNYQIKTWRKADFLEELERVERASIAHAGLDPARAEALLNRRLSRDLQSMLRTSLRVRDRRLVRSIASVLDARYHLGVRAKLAFLLGRSTGWYPARLY